MADIAPSSSEGHEGLYGGNIRVGSVLRTCVSFCIFSSTTRGAFVVTSPLDSAFVLLDEPLVVTPFTLPRVFGAMLSSVPDVTSRAFPFVDGANETVES